MTAVVTAARSAFGRPESRTRLLGEQMFVMAGQLVAGVGHLAFAVVVARLLTPGDFAAFAAFQAMYLVIRAVVGSLIAGGSLDPEWSTQARAQTTRISTRIAVVVGALSLVVGRLFHLDATLVVLLAIAGPGAALFALDQGRLFGLLRHGRAVAGQVAGPVVRMAIGIPLAAGFGATGAALATVIGGYAAVAVVRPRAAERAGVDVPSALRAARQAGASEKAGTGHRPAAPVAVVAFLLLAVVQNQDVMFANRLLDGVDAGRFAVLSTLGGAVAFATATIPFVLLPRARDGQRALAPALLVAGALGAVPVGVVAVASRPIVTLIFGQRYADAAPLATRYVLAMAFLGVARVLVANLCRSDRWSRTAPAIVGVAAVAQIVALVVAGSTAGSLATITLATTALTALTAAALIVFDLRLDRTGGPAGGAGTPVEVRPLRRRRRGPIRAVRRSPTGSHDRPPLTPRRRPTQVISSIGSGRFVAAVTVLGLVLRVVTAGRSVWVDEAISIEQATMPFGDMLTDLGNGDVHPPLYAAVLWVAVRVLGTAELAVRTPSIIAGTLLLPMVHVVAKEFFDRRTARVAIVLVAVSPFLIWYSQEARMYGLVMLFGLVALWAQVRALDGGRWWHWAAHAAASAAMIWTHYFAIVPVAVQQAVFAHEWWRRRRAGQPSILARWAPSAVGLALLVAPLVPFLLHQLSTNRAIGGMTDGSDALPQAGDEPASAGTMSVYRVGANLVWAMWGFHPTDVMTRIAALWPLLMLLALFLLGRGWSRRSRWLVAVAVVPPLTFLALGFVRDGLFEVRYFAAAVVPFLVLIASWIVTAARSKGGVVVATTLLSVTMLVGLVDQKVNNENPRVYDFAGAVAQVEHILEPGDVFVYGPDYLGTVVAYYYENAPVPARVMSDDIPDLEDGQRVVVLGSFLDVPSVSGEIGTYLARLDREATLVETIHKGTEVRIWVYE